MMISFSMAWMFERFGPGDSNMESIVSMKGNCCLRAADHGGLYCRHRIRFQTLIFRWLRQVETEKSRRGCRCENDASKHFPLPFTRYLAQARTNHVIWELDYQINIPTILLFHAGYLVSKLMPMKSASVLFPSLREVNLVKRSEPLTRPLSVKLRLVQSLADKLFSPRQKFETLSLLHSQFLRFFRFSFLSLF